jgi:DNA polymerase (family 10)
VTTTRIPLGRASLLAASATREAARAGIPPHSLTTTGSLRRFAPDIGDATLLATIASAHQADVLDRFAALPLVTAVLDRSTTMVRLATSKGPLTVHIVRPDSAGAALVWHTGSRSHTAALAARGQRMGLRFAAGELRREGGGPVVVPTEEELYRLLELPFIPPELREGSDEITAAEQGRLPALVSHSHIRGDLHVHTTWSDGRDSVKSMVAAAASLGYEYIAITDHSERAWSSRKLSASDVPRQREEIDAVREESKGIAILHGIEVDIMQDGTLDFDDRLLETFDIVLASLHDHGGHGRATLTERYLSAIRHPLVNVITHPANRSPALSNGYDLDFDRLFASAAASGTALEIDGAPGHLDMDGRLARRAIAAGVTVTIDSDSHRAEALGRQMRYGVGTARRGWIEPRHVLTARGVDEVQRFIARKRGARHEHAAW